jgi:ABC-type multidrug transport system fused ATPase/permease subunit
VHNNIIKGLLYASLTNFFNRVPVGRILNRLGKDLKELDESIAPNFSSFLISFFRILSAVFICIYTSTPYALIPIAFVAVIFIKVRIFYLNGQNKLIRLEKISNSPLVVSFTNGIRGAASIRCYSSCKQFLQTHIQLVNNYRRVLLNHFAASGWFLMILVYVGYIVNMFCIGFCMFSSNQNPAYIGLLLSYILNMNDEIYSFVLEEADFET